MDKFTKDDIKQGYKVKLRSGSVLDMDEYCGERYFRQNRMDAEVGGMFWIPICPLSDYNDDLRYYGQRLITNPERHYEPHWDIMFVYDKENNTVYNRYQVERGIQEKEAEEIWNRRKEKIKSFFSIFK